MESHENDTDGMQALSQEALDSLTEEFHEVDANKDGAIDHAEILAILAEVTLPSFRESVAHLGAAISISGELGGRIAWRFCFGQGD